MSNKTQLQANNDELDALIARVNAAKNTAASLPEAGGGGTGESCTITIPFTPDPGTNMYYMDNNMVFCEVEIMRGQSYTVIKDSLFIVSGSLSLVGGATQKAVYGMNAIYQATG